MRNFLIVIIAGFVLLSLVVIGQTGRTAAGFQLEAERPASAASGEWRIFAAGENQSPAVYRLENNRLLRMDAAGEWNGDPEATQLTVFSENGSFVALVASLIQPAADAPVSTWQVQVLNNELMPIRQLELPRYLDEGPPVIAVSGVDGQLIFGRSATGEVFFRDANNSLQREVQLFDDAEFDLERTLLIVISGDGEHVAVLASKRGAAPADSRAPSPSGEPHLFLFTNNGELLWQIPLEGYSASRLSFRPDGQQILTASHRVFLKESRVQRYTQIYDLEGDPLWGDPFLFKLADFSANNRYLGLADNQTLMLVDLQSATILWKKSLPVLERMITAISVDNSGNCAALVAKNEFINERFVFSQPEVSVFNSSGVIEHSLQLTDQRFLTPALLLSGDGLSIYTGVEQSFYTFRKKS